MSNEQDDTIEQSGEEPDFEAARRPAYHHKPRPIAEILEELAAAA